MNAMRDRIALEGCGAWEGENIVSIDFWFFEEKKREINKKKHSMKLFSDWQVKSSKQGD